MRGRYAARNHQINPLKQTALRLFLLANSLELVLVTAAVAGSTSMDRSAVFLGYSPARLTLIGFAGGGAILFAGLAVASLRNPEGLRKLSRFLEPMGSPNARLFVRDLLIGMTLAVLSAVFLQRYSPQFLGFVWGPLPAVIERTLPLLLYTGLFCIQALALLAYPALRNRPNPGPAQSLAAVLKAGAAPALIFIALLSAYLFAIKITGRIWTNIAYFPELAEAFLDGRLYLEDPVITKDLSLFNGRYFVSFPPLAALLFLPTVARSSHFAVDPIAFSSWSAAAGGVFLFLALRALACRGWVRLREWQLAIITIAVTLGTPLFYMAATGAVWHISQVLTFTFLSLAVWITLADRGDLGWEFHRTALLAGVAMALAALARPHITLASVFLLGIVIQRDRDSQKFRRWRTFSWAAVYALPVVLAAGALMWYNAARFENPLDFGYVYMLVGPELSEPLATFGQFHPRFILQNLRANWFGLPYWHESCRRLVPSKDGLSLLITTPIVLYTASTIKSRKAWIIGAWISVGAIAGLHLLYFNTGGHQFGYRFSVDFMPIVAVLLAVGLQRRFNWLPVVLVLYSIGVNFIGVLWDAKLFCDTW